VSGQLHLNFSIGLKAKVKVGCHVQNTNHKTKSSKLHKNHITNQRESSRALLQLFLM